MNSDQPPKRQPWKPRGPVSSAFSAWLQQKKITNALLVELTARRIAASLRRTLGRW